MSARKAIFNILKSWGDIQVPIVTITNFEDGIQNPDIPYIVIKDESPIESQYRRGLENYRIFYHNDQGTIDIIDNVIDNILLGLLDKVQLIDPDNLNKIDIEATGDVSPITKNDDDTISKGRLFVLPNIVGV